MFEDSNKDDVICAVVMSLLLTLNIFHTSVSVIDFEQLNVCCVLSFLIEKGYALFTLLR